MNIPNMEIKIKSSCNFFLFFRTLFEYLINNYIITFLSVIIYIFIRLTLPLHIFYFLF